MNFKNTLAQFPVILINGPLGTRLKYNYNFNLGPDITTFDLINSQEGRHALNEIYQHDIDVAREFNLPMIINAPTFRSSKNFLIPRGFTNKEDVEKVNAACINFTKIIVERNRPQTKVFLSAPLGSMHDAYSTTTIPSIEEAQKYHQEQIDIFREFELDLMMAVTLPSLSEALGLARAAEEASFDYTIGFVLNKKGQLLDETPLYEAIEKIDQQLTKKPLGYMITCTHAAVVFEKLSPHHKNHARIIGIQANGSNNDISTLNALKTACADSPISFAHDIDKLRKIFNLKIVGGCCGTDTNHLREIAEKIGHQPH